MRSLRERQSFAEPFRHGSEYEYAARVYLLTPKWFVRPRNTDWRYVRYSLPRIREYAPDCEFYLARAAATTLRANIRYVSRRVRQKLQLSCGSDFGPRLDRRDFRRSLCSVVFCHDEFPQGAESASVIWQNSILDPGMVLSYGRSAQLFEAEILRKEKGFASAAAVLVSTEAERQRLSRWFSHLARKFVAIPFFLPGVHAMSAAEWEQKAEPRNDLHCLFAGHEAKRKGLSRVYDALSRLPASVRRRIHLTVVSRFADGPICTPALPNIRIEQSASHDRVLQLMRASHVLVMPSLFESYGFVYLEAMANGAVPIVPDWEVQREIVEDGKAGIVTGGEPRDIAYVLQRLCEDHQLWRTMSWNALQRFEQHFEPSRVAAQFQLLFHRVINESGRRCAAQ